MIRDVFTALAMLIAKYDKCGSDGPLLHAGRFTQAHKLSLKQKCTWAKDDLKEAEKLRHMLAGHMENLSFAMQIINTAALTSIEKCIERNTDEFEERHRETIALRINNTRKSDLENVPKFNPYLESVIANLNSTIATNDPPDLEEDTA